MTGRHPAILGVLLLAGCHTAPQIPQHVVQGTIERSVQEAAQPRTRPAAPAAVSDALLPPLAVEPPGPSRPVEPRFDLVVSNAPAQQVFMALVAGTRYSMLLHPDIKEPLTINLKDVTLVEAL